MVGFRGSKTVLLRLPDFNCQAILNGFAGFVGKVVDSNEVGQMNLVLYRNAIAGSNTGGIRETQELVDFCALDNIRPEVTTIAMHEIDDAWERVVAKQARYRFVMDLGRA